MRVPTRPGWRRTPILAALAVVTVTGSLAIPRAALAADDGGTSDSPILGIWEVQSLNGINNNPNSPTAGAAGTRYLRLGPARYADGRSQMASGPNARYISNREFNDINVNVFSERGVTQWGNVWGQFIDHNIGLRQDAGTTANIPFNPADPAESFTNTLGYIPFVRTPAAPGTGVSNVRQHINTETSFIDAEAIYGTSDTRLDWLRPGSLDGNPDNNSGSMLMSSTNYLPNRAARGNPSVAPTMQMDGHLLSHPNDAKVTGDVRANEQFGLTAVQTLFAREHNRIVSSLPSSLSQYDKFQLARAVVVAEIQYVTYNEFLPAMGVSLPSYQGYDPSVDPSNAHEFATVGYRAHSFIHGEVEADTNVSRYTQSTLDDLGAQGIEVALNGTNVHLTVPLNVGFFNPDLVEKMQLGPVLKGFSDESDYKNDEMIDNQLRSVLFQVPVSGNPSCLDGPTLPQCFSGVVDLGAIDLQRGRDHGMPTYNQMRNTYGLSSKSSFMAITGESTESFPAGLGVDSPQCNDIVAMFDGNGNPTTNAANNAVRVVKRCPLAARLKAIYGSVSNVDAFAGMLAEPHVSGSELGELQLASWKDQFGALRDGDRFFYVNDPLQSYIRNNFRIDSRVTLAQLIARNSDIPQTTLPANVFRLPQFQAAGIAAAQGQAAETAPSATTRHDGHPRSATTDQPANIPTRTGPRALHARRRRVH